jgi:hypothetical protein
MTETKRCRERRSMLPVHPDAAAIDIVATVHVAAVGLGRDPEPVRSFGTFTGDLHRLTDWFAQCRISCKMCTIWSKAVVTAAISPRPITQPCSCAALTSLRNGMRAIEPRPLPKLCSIILFASTRIYRSPGLTLQPGLQPMRVSARLRRGARTTTHRALSYHLISHAVLCGMSIAV